MMNNFNPEIYNLVSLAGGMVTDNKVEFSKIGFENFMMDFVGHVQDRQRAIVEEAERRHTYMGEDVPSWIIISEVYNSIRKNNA